MSVSLLWAPRAWVGGGWKEAVLLRAGDDGRWDEITPGVAAPPQAAVLPGPALQVVVRFAV